ncbi:MAG: putative peptidoglycan glycosyltransferase FtsW [Pseudomonadota bacterium]
MVEAVFARLEARSPAWQARVLSGFDHHLVYAFGALAVLGLVLSFAAGPVAAARIGIADSFHFTERHVLFLAVTIIGTVTTALLPITMARRLGILAGLGALVLIVGVLLFGMEIKGARRWLHLGSFGLQPSEFLKPGFVMIAAWFLSAKPEDGFPGSLASLGLYGFASVLLLLQPDYGQWILLTGIWAVMFFVAGWSWAWIGGLGSAAVAALGVGYVTQDHVRSRIDRFLAPGSGETYQTDKAAEAISSGGVFGHDLHEAAGVKASLPDAHTDFIYAVAVEEFGVLMGLVIIGLFVVIGWRGLVAALSTEDVFRRCAIAGLTSAVCLQASINIGVNVGLLPAKGMTLPFVSYGGSSTLAMGFTAGLLLVLTRRRKT